MNTRAWMTLSLAMTVSTAFAQSAERGATWTGLSIGGIVGSAEPDNNDADVLFDTGLDGSFADTVRTAAGTNAFSPGFCGGAALGATPAAGCAGDDGGAESGVRVGYDWQVRHWVFGVAAEYSAYDIRDSVSAFSTTPAFYTLTRELQSALSLRGRVGIALGIDDRWLAYLTGGGTRARIDSTFTTSNAANAFEQREEGSDDGVQTGIGMERRVTEDLEIGLLYLRTRIDDEDFRVRATRGAAPDTNPFILTDPNGTDFARSDDASLGALRVSATWRF